MRSGFQVGSIANNIIGSSEAVSTLEIYIHEVFFADGKLHADFGMVVIYPTSRVRDFPDKHRAPEYEFTASSTLQTFTLPQFKLFLYPSADRRSISVKKSEFFPAIWLLENCPCIAGRGKVEFLKGGVAISNSINLTGRLFMVKRLFCLVAVGILLTACAKVPVARQIQSSFPIDKPFEAAWQAVIEVFAELNLPISNMEKVSGLIVTDWISFRYQDNKTGYCDCGTVGFPFSETDRRGKFNVYVKKTSEGTCEVKVNSVFEMISSYQEANKNTNCVSTGKLEVDIYRRVQEKLK